MTFEKLPLSSKKFLAFFFTEILLCAMAMTALVSGTISWPISAFMLAIALTMGTLGVGYILGQAALDKYTRIAQITGTVKNPTEINNGTEATLE